MCFFFSPAIAGTQLAPGLNAHTYDLSVAEIDAIKAVVTSMLKNPESARFSTIVASENEKTGQITACGYVNAKKVPVHMLASSPSRARSKESGLSLPNRWEVP